MNLLTQKEAEQNKEIANKFKVGYEYGIQIKPKVQTPIRLTQAKISTFSKGFNFVVGQAKYPTFIMVYKTFYEEGCFHIRGKLRDNDDTHYRLSMEIEKGKNKIKCGYNKTGDDVILILCRKLNESKGDNFLQYEGKMQVVRDDQIYYVKPTGYEADACILSKHKESGTLVFNIETYAYQIDQE